MAISSAVPAYIEKLTHLLLGDLNFTGGSEKNYLHNFHSFPAKFPAELPKAFILALTNIEENVLDPMVGSGTTVLEAFLCGRRGIGFDIDPLALLISRVKTSSPNPDDVLEVGLKVVASAKVSLASSQQLLLNELQTKWDEKTKAFIDYWFLPQTQLELLALLREIEQVTDLEIRDFLVLTFSSIIITKSGGVSLAMDLGHTRPHKVPVIMENQEKGKIVRCKRIRSAIKDFEKKFVMNLNALRSCSGLINEIRPQIHNGYAQDLLLRDESVDLIVTSPPYASNAIDYMRAHKFSLVWLGYSIEELSKTRSEYIGAHSIKDIKTTLPRFTKSIVSDMAKVDESKSKILYSYFTDMKLALEEMFRVLKPGKAAVLVVGNSVIKGKNTCTAECLAEIGKCSGFKVPAIGKRNIDRDHRMMPVGNQVNLNSTVQNRMHEEYVIGFYKPC
ncbi:MAG: DNA methyltransferase [Dehalococcoidia bacterium]